MITLNILKWPRKIRNIIIFLAFSWVILGILLVVVCPSCDSDEYIFLKFSIPRYSPSESFAVHGPDYFIGSSADIKFITRDSCGDIFSFYKDKLEDKKMTLLGEGEYGDLTGSTKESYEFWERSKRKVPTGYEGGGADIGYQTYKWQNEKWFITLRCKDYFDKFKGIFTIINLSNQRE